MLLSPEQFQLHASLSSSSESPPGSEPFPSPRASWNPLLPPVTASGHVHSVCGGAGVSRLPSLHPPTHQPGPWGHALEGQGEPGPGPAVPTSRPGSTRHLSASFRGAGTAPAQTRVIFKELVAAEGSRNRRPGQPRRLCPETQDGGRGAAGQLPAQASARPALLRVPVGPQAARVPLSFWGSLRGTRGGGGRKEGARGRDGTAQPRGGQLAPRPRPQRARVEIASELSVPWETHTLLPG